MPPYQRAWGLRTRAAPVPSPNQAGQCGGTESPPVPNGLTRRRRKLAWASAPYHVKVEDAVEHHTQPHLGKPRADWEDRRKCWFPAGSGHVPSLELAVPFPTVRLFSQSFNPFLVTSRTYHFLRKVRKRPKEMDRAASKLGGNLFSQRSLAWRRTLLRMPARDPLRAADQTA